MKVVTNRRRTKQKKEAVKNLTNKNVPGNEKDIRKRRVEILKHLHAVIESYKKRAEPVVEPGLSGATPPPAPNMLSPSTSKKRKLSSDGGESLGKRHKANDSRCVDSSKSNTDDSHSI